MIRTVKILASIAIVMAAAGCDKNDENTINSIPKTHDVYPVFRLVVDNGLRTFGVDSVEFTFEASMPGYRVFNTVFDTIITKRYWEREEGINVVAVFPSDVKVTQETFLVPPFGIDIPHMYVCRIIARGAPASALRITFDLTSGGSVASASMVNNVPGCAQPLLAISGDELTVTWGSACVDSSEEIVFQVISNNGPLQVIGANWIIPSLPVDAADIEFVGANFDIQSDQNGFIGAIGSGTYFTGIFHLIDTIFVRVDSVSNSILDVDTTRSLDTASVVFSFEPLGRYIYHFDRNQPFMWNDSFLVEFIRSVDTSWVLKKADTVDVTDSIDFSRNITTVLDSVAPIINPSDTIGNGPDSIYREILTYGLWFDYPPIVITKPEDTLVIRPTSIYKDTIDWGFWERVDTFFLPADSSVWCDSTYIKIETTLFTDPNGFPLYLLDTLRYWTQCQPIMNTQRTRIYREFGWGGNDTTVYSTYPDTLKGLIFTPDSLMIYNTITFDTVRAIIEVTGPDGVDSVAYLRDLPLVMPPVEVYPDHTIKIIQPEN